MATSPENNPTLIKIYWILLILGTIAAAFFQDPIIISMEDQHFAFQPSNKEVESSEPEALNLDIVSETIAYPAECKEENIQGQVKMRILVDETGKPVLHEVVSSPHPLLTKACEEVIYDLQFKPALDAGTPVTSWVTIPFTFEAEKNELYS